jgi:hypothetical protein
MRIACAAPLLLLAGALACNDTSGSQSTSGSDGGAGDGGDVTPVGTSTGPVVPGTIGPAGGQISSADGRLTLIVPAGALSAQTMFGIEPITNQAPQGIGAAYRLTPDGQQFTMPATVSFKYGDADVLGTNEQLLMVAYQDPVAHDWLMDSQTTIDANSRSAQIQTTHLTDYALLAGYNLFPKDTSVQVGGTVPFVVVVCNGSPLLCDSTSHSPTGLVNWAVNGAPGGTTGTGIVMATDGYHATYTAPSKVPSPNTVTVSAQTPGRGATIVVAQVHIGGLIHVDANLNYPGDSVCALAKADVTEHFSLDLNLSPPGTISNVKSDAPVLMNVKSDLGDMFTTQMGSNPEFFKPTMVKDIQYGPNGTLTVILEGTSVSGSCTDYTVGGQFIGSDPGGNIETINMIIPYDPSKFGSSGKQTEPATMPANWTLTLSQ